MELKELITNDLRVLRLIAEDIEDQNELTDTLSEPDLIYESNEDLLKLINEYNTVSDRLEQRLSVYVAEANKTNEPIQIGLYKIYKGLKNGGNRCTLTPKGQKKD